MSQAVAAAPEPQDRSIGFLGLMRNRNYALLWWGQLVSELGNRFHWIAISLWVYSATQSVSAVSLAIAATFVGNLVVGLWAGVLIDWFNRKRILIISDIARILLVALIPTLIKVNILLVYVDLALISMATAFFRPAMFAVVPTIVNRQYMLPANSFFTAMDTGTEILGPALAGLIAVRYGYPPLLYLDAATYAFSALCLLGIGIPHREQVGGARMRWRPVVASISQGLRYIRHDPLQWGLFALIFPAYLVGSGLNALQTPLAKGVVGITDAEFGTFNSIWGVGFLVASLALGWFGSNLRKSQLILGGFFLGFAATGAMGLSKTVDMLFVTAFTVGFANTLNYVGLTTVLMEHTPQEVIGRVIATRQVALGAIRIVSPLVFGAVGDVWGVRPAIFIMVLVGLVGTSAVAILNPVLRQFDSLASQSRSGIRGLLDSMINRTNPEFNRAQQGALNLIAIVIVIAVWSGMVYRTPLYAMGALLSVLGLASLGGLITTWLQPLGGNESLERLFARIEDWYRSIMGGHGVEGDSHGHSK